MSRRARIKDRCKLCQSRPVKFVNSHIIPRSFFRLFRGNDPHSIALDVGGNVNQVHKKQAGFADPEMLCESCEKKFSNFDSYGWKTLGSRDLTENPLTHQLRLYGYAVPCDADLIHRFILSIYWRASVSGTGFTENFKLYRRYEDQILKDIFGSNPISAQYYQTIVFKLAEDYLGTFSKTMFEPLASFQPDKSVMCQFYLPGLKIVTFIDGPAQIAEWLKIHKPDQFILPLLDGSRNQQELAFLERIHRRYHQRPAKSRRLRN
jgi:hypothetical protein